MERGKKKGEALITYFFFIGIICSCYFVIEQIQVTSALFPTSWKFLYPENLNLKLFLP
jgi:hypothetical protein